MASAMVLISCHKTSDLKKEKLTFEVVETKENSSNLKQIVENFKNSEEYLTAIKTRNMVNSTIALQSLFNKYRVLDFFSNLDDLNKHILADFNNNLNSLNILSHKSTLNISESKKIVNNLSEITKTYKIKSDFTHKETIVAMDTLIACLQNLLKI